MPNLGDIERLAGFVPEPYRRDEVMAALRTLQPPFLLRQVVDASGLPKEIVHRVLDRLHAKGVLTRQKVIVTYPAITGGQGGRRDRIRITPGAARHRVYAYRLAEGQ